MNAINVVGNAILIFGFDMGVAGAAIPTLVSRMVAAGLIMAIVGGALLTPWMAQIISDNSSVWCALTSCFPAEWDNDLKLSQMSLRASFIVPVICFAVVGIYALIFRGKSTAEAK